MNSCLNNYIAVEGQAAALELAGVLLKNNYQVFIQYDDCNIFLVSWEHNDDDMGTPRFAAVTIEEEEDICERRKSE